MAADTGVWGDVHLVEDLRIGTLDGADETIFGRISYVVAGQDGTIYVADAQLETLRAYDAEGTFLRTIGRKGEGPGEYLQIAGVTMLPNGDLAIYDGQNTRITLFRPDGSAVRDFRISHRHSTSDMLFHDDDGNLYLRSSDPSQAAPGQIREVLLKVSPAGAVIDRIQLPERGTSGIELISPEGPQIVHSPGPLWAWSPMGYVVVGYPQEYVLELRHPSAPAKRMQRSFDPVDVLPEERKQWEAWGSFFSKQSIARGQPPRDHPVPVRKTAFKALGVSEDGLIWVQRHVTATKREVTPRSPGDERPLTPWRESPSFDVFDPDGRFLGSVSLPRDTRIAFRRARQAWGVTTDDAGEHVVRFRIESR
jgi:hypothetical protein